MKSTLSGDEPLQLVRFYEQNEEFPHDSSADQFFNADRFESYRQLGFHVASSVCGLLPMDFRRRADEISTGQFIQMITGGAKKERSESQVDLLIATLLDKNKDSADREQAALELSQGHAHEAGAVLALIEGLASRDPLLAKTCSLALQSMSTNIIAQLRDHGLTHNLAKVRAGVAHILSELFAEATEVDPKTIDALLVMFHGPNHNGAERQAALSALQTICVSLGQQAGQQDVARQVRHQITAPSRAKGVGSE